MRRYRGLVSHRMNKSALSAKPKTGILKPGYRFGNQQKSAESAGAITSDQKDCPWFHYAKWRWALDN